MPMQPSSPDRNIRKQSVELAQEDLAASFEAFEAARIDEREAGLAVGRRAAQAMDPAAGDEDVEAFAAWLPEGRRRIDAARARRDRAEAAIVLARAVLSAARQGQAADELRRHRAYSPAETDDSEP